MPPSETSPDDHVMAARYVACSDRPADDPPHEVHMLADLGALYRWADAHGVRVYLVSSDVDGRHIYTAHHKTQSRVAKGPPRERLWRITGFPT